MAAIHGITSDLAVREVTARYRPSGAPAPHRDEIIFWRDADDGDQVLADGHLATIEHAHLTAEGTIVVTAVRRGTLTYPADALTARRITCKPPVPALTPSTRTCSPGPPGTSSPGRRQPPA
jgi:hypothetical protein